MNDEWRDTPSVLTCCLNELFIVHHLSFIIFYVANENTEGLSF